MTVLKRSLPRGLALAAAALMSMAWASDDAALDLKPADTPSATGGGGLKLFAELAAGRLSQRYGLGHEDARRASLDLLWTFKPAPQWRGVLSNRLDDIHPVEAGGRSTLNSLREAALGWQEADGRFAFDIGRINHRNGPAYGFNPTDYFRDGSSRAVTTADPLALRENRLGTVMLRSQALWQGGSLSLAVAPKLRNAPSRESFSVDLGATNHADRALLALGLQPGGAVSGQAFAFHQRGRGWQIGANATALLGDALVGFAEWSGGRDTDLLSATFDPAPRVRRAQRAVVGATYTTASSLSVTAELQYNGFALRESEWRQALASYGLEAMGAYLYEVQRRQDTASRRAAMLYVSQANAFVKHLDLTGLVRFNLEDSSRFAWVEARYHWPRFDLALQWQANLGRADSEFGALPGKRLVQVLATVYF